MTVAAAKRKTKGAKPAKTHRQKLPWLDVLRRLGKPQDNTSNGAPKRDIDGVTEDYSQPEGYAQVITAQSSHIGTRSYQQDALYVSESHYLVSGGKDGRAYAVLCDGMGGTEYGAEASALVVEAMVNALDALSPDDDIANRLFSLTQELDIRVFECLGAEQAGTTVVAVYLDGNQMYWVSVGDSRIYLLHQEAITLLTRDHNLLMALEHEVELGRLTEDELETFPRKDALISFLGQGGLTLIDRNTEPIRLQSDDIVLLCSDGLTNSLSDEQIGSLVFETYDNLSETARRLPLEAFDTGGEKDNTSIVLLHYLE
ncbi:MAG: protein phosphatase 2C domain-containing protein [Coriobacteriales bacterium]|jgi:protein phosphatase|nr:protein phosphatase 2C domain-containing protein [Coriobacteriales bacterium]